MIQIKLTRLVPLEIPKNSESPAAFIFKRPFLRGVYSEGLMYGGKLAIGIGPALALGGNLPFLLCFTLYLRAISKYKSPGGLYL